MPSGAGNDTLVGGSIAEAEPAVLEATSALTANAPFLPADEEMHISPHSPKRPRLEPRSPNMSLDGDGPETKRPRRDSGLADRRSRSPRPKSPLREKPYRERSRSRNRSQSRDSRSHSRGRFSRYSKSPEASRGRRDSDLRRDSWRRDSRHSSPPYQRRRPSGVHSNAGVPETGPRDVRRQASMSQEERKRGQRLYGDLFSGLGQPTARARTGLGAGATRGGRGTAVLAGPEGRRSETTGDRRPERPQQTGEERQKQAERLAKLERIRKIEQVKLDEKKMHTMHANELVLAQSLRTRSKPALYYRPCSFTEAQKRVVEDQFRSAKRRIEQEEEDFEKEKQTRLAALDVRYSPKPAAPDKNERDAVPEEADSDKPTGSGSLDTDMAPPPTQQDADATDAMVDETDEKARPGPKPGTASSENHAGHEFHDDKDRGIMVETEEDTVIY